MMERAIQVADAVMYEGAFLYPYRSSSLKNRYRWTFGVLPARAAGADAVAALGMTGTCLLRGQPHARVEVLLRCLTDDGQELQPHELRASSATGTQRIEFRFAAVTGGLTLERCSLGRSYERLRVTVDNRTRARGGDAWPRSFERERALHGVHLLLHVERRAHFVSLTDPPTDALPFAAHCEGAGLWCCVLGSDRVRPDLALAAPIILPDFPQIAPESCTPLCDATEIDEMLALRIRTLSPTEKQQARATHPWVGAMLDRVEALTEQQLWKLHGARRAHTGDQDEHASLRGSRVVLHPRRRADAFDILLRGRRATVQQIERSVDGEVLVCVTLDDDPGCDLGAQGLPGHRFFFGLDELELLDDGAAG